MQVVSDDMASNLSGLQGSKPGHHARQRGVKLIGATAHDVMAGLDERPIIEQDTERVGHQDTPGDLIREGRDIERRVIARAIARHLDGRMIANRAGPPCSVTDGQRGAVSTPPAHRGGRAPPSSKRRRPGSHGV